MYMGEPHSVAAIVFNCRCRANPKSAGRTYGVSMSLQPIFGKTLSTQRYELKLLPILMLVFMELDLRPSGWQSKIFWGFRSLWRMPLLCRTFMALAIWCRNTRMVSSLSVPLAVKRREIHYIGSNVENADFYLFYVLHSIL